jgi:pimeloyl-ACP methyl ester carboxylesterase
VVLRRPPTGEISCYNPPMPLQRVGDVELYYESEGQGPPLLLIHGTGADATSWDPVVPFLAAGRRVIRYDRRGYSRSPAAPFGRKDYWRHHADDAAALLSALGVPNASVLGWSSGGVVALALGVYHAGQVGKTLLYEPPFRASRHLSLGMIFPFLKIMLNRFFGRKRQAAEAFFRMTTANADGHSAYDRMSDAEKAQLLANSDALLAELDGGTGEELSDTQLQTLRGTVMVGSDTASFLPAAADDLVRRAPHISLVRIGNAGHLFPREQPGRFSELADPYL